MQLSSFQTHPSRAEVVGLSLPQFPPPQAPLFPHAQEELHLFHLLLCEGVAVKAVHVVGWQLLDELLLPVALPGSAAYRRLVYRELAEVGLGLQWRSTRSGKHHISHHDI